MPESVYVDLTPGLANVPASTWAGVSSRGVMDILVSNLRDGVDPKGLSLREVLDLQEPAHALVRSGFFNPGGGFELSTEFISAQDALDFLHKARGDYLREAWTQGDEAIRPAIDLFAEIEGSELVLGLRDALPKPKQRLRDRLLGRTATTAS